MPRNGSGSYTPVNVPVISGTTISSSAFNGTINDISTALTQSVSADGQTTITANQNMYGYKHTNVAAAVNGTDYAPLWQVQNGYGKALSAVSGADTITAVTTPGLAAYQAGGLYQFIPAANNATTTPTLNINSLGARSIVWHDGTALKAGDLVQGAIFSLYDDGTKFRVLPTGGSNYGIAGGTVDAITATIAVGAAYADGMIVRIQATGANTSATPTLNVNSIGAKTIVKLGNMPLSAGDIAGADFVAQLHYDLSLDKWVLENPATTASFASFKNLKITTTGTNATVTLTSDAVVIENSATVGRTIRNVSVSINTATTGANALDTGTIAASTWYYIHVIYNPTTNTVAGLASLSATSPTLPSGYTMSARAGAFPTDGTANKYPLSLKQFGRKVQYVVAAGTNVTAVPQMSSGVQGSVTTPTWVAVSVNNFVPPTAGAIRVMTRYAGSGFGSAVAPNNAYGSPSSANPPPLMIQSTDANGAVLSADFVLEGTNIYWASPGVSGLLACVGWEDNI